MHTKFQTPAQAMYTYHKVGISWLDFRLSKNPDSIGKLEGLIQHILSLHVTFGDRKDVVRFQFLRHSIWKRKERSL